MAGNDFGESAFAGTVRSHDGVHLTPRHGQTEAPDDLLIADGYVEIINPKFVHKLGRQEI